MRVLIVTMGVLLGAGAGAETCEEQWPDDPEMRSYCEELQGYEPPGRARRPRLSADEIIRSTCRKQWGEDGRMRRYCIEQQRAELRDVRRFMRNHGLAGMGQEGIAAAAEGGDRAAELLLRCADRHPADYRALARCLERLAAEHPDLTF